MTIQYLGLHHSSLLVRNLPQSLAFYQNLLGMTVSPNRPDIGFDGAWLLLGQQQLHLLELPSPDPQHDRPEHVGRDRHVAFSVREIDSVIQVLKENDIPFTMSRSGRQAVFFRDPDGNGLEFVSQQG